MPKENSEIKVIKFSILWIFIAIVIIALILAFFKSNIFATNEPEKEKIIAFEKNEKAVNLIEIMVENTNQNKKLVNEEREVPFSTEYEDNPNLPKDENQEKQAGKIINPDAIATKVSRLQIFTASLSIEFSSDI